MSWLTDILFEIFRVFKAIMNGLIKAVIIWTFKERVLWKQFVEYDVAEFVDNFMSILMHECVVTFKNI